MFDIFFHSFVFRMKFISELDDEQDEHAKVLLVKSQYEDSIAQYRIAKLYEEGKGFEKSKDKAMEWYEKAARGGHLCAKLRLFGYIDKVLTNEQRAAMGDLYKKHGYFKEAAKCYEESHYFVKLGELYEDRDDSEQSYEEAAKLYRKTAYTQWGMGDLNAQFHLGRLYENGNGVEQSYEEAAKWYRRASEIDEDYFYSVDFNYSPCGNADAQFHLGRLYENGTGVEQCFSTATTLYERAGWQGHVEAQLKMGQLYEECLIPIDEEEYDWTRTYEEAAEWYEKAYKNGIESALDKLVYVTGKYSRNKNF